MTEIDGRPEQRSQIADRVSRLRKVVPGSFHHVRKALRLEPSFPHEFKNQKLTKSQSSQALKIRGEASRLSLLSLKVQILIYRSVCHVGRRGIHQNGSGEICRIARQH